MYATASKTNGAKETNQMCECEKWVELLCIFFASGGGR
jgi:hypothetical protein